MKNANNVISINRKRSQRLSELRKKTFKSEKAFRLLSLDLILNHLVIPQEKDHE